MRVIVVAFFLFIGIILIFSNHNNLSAHNFYQNNDSVLFTLIKQFEIEKNLAAAYLYTNKSVGLIHSERADVLLDQIVSINSDIIKISNFVNKYNSILPDLDLTTKALVAANIADTSLLEYGLSTGLDSKKAACLLNMSIGMIMKMNESSNMNMTDGISGHGYDKMNSMFGSNQSSSHFLSQSDKDVKILADYETSSKLAELLKILFAKYLQNANLKNSSGLMPIPTEMKINAIRELGQRIENLALAVKRNAPVEEVYSIVHGQIHPNLFIAFGLKLKCE